MEDTQRGQKHALAAPAVEFLRLAGYLRLARAWNSALTASSRLMFSTGGSPSSVLMNTEGRGRTSPHTHKPACSARNAHSARDDRRSSRRGMQRQQ